MSLENLAVAGNVLLDLFSRSRRSPRFAYDAQKGAP